MNTSKEAKKRLQAKSKDNKSRSWPIVLAIIGASIIVGGANIGTGYFIWSQTSNKTTPFIACSESGDLITGATIKVTLINNADWDNVSITTGEGWTKTTSHTFTKTNEDAITDENVVITLDGGNAINLTISSGYTPDPTYKVYTMKTDGTDEYFSFIDNSGISPNDTNQLSGWKNGNQMGASDISFLDQHYDELIIPSGITSIAERAFYGCASFRDATHPLKLMFKVSNDFTEIGTFAFSGCAGITMIDFSKSGNGAITSIGQGAFYGCKLANVVPGGRIKNITPQNWGNIHIFGLPEYNTPDYANKSLYDQNCGCLAYGTFTPTLSISTIAPSAFGGCAGITSVDFSQNKTTITSIGGNAFSGCELNNVKPGNGIVNVIPSTNIWGDDMHIFGVQGFTPNYWDNDSAGALYQSNCGSLAYGVFSPTDTSKTTIGNGAFNGCAGITKVDLKQTPLTTIGSNAFYSCINIQTYIFAPSQYSDLTLGTFTFFICSLFGEVSCFDSSKASTILNNMAASSAGTMKVGQGFWESTNT